MDSFTKMEDDEMISLVIVMQKMNFMVDQALIFMDYIVMGSTRTGVVMQSSIWMG